MISDAMERLNAAVDGFFQRHPDAKELKDVLSTWSDIQKHKYDFEQMGFPLGLVISVYSFRDVFSRAPADWVHPDHEEQIRVLAQQIKQMP